MNQIDNYPERVETNNFLNLISEKHSHAISPKSLTDIEVDTQETNTRSSKEGKEAGRASKEATQMEKSHGKRSKHLD